MGPPDRPRTIVPLASLRRYAPGATPSPWLETVPTSIFPALISVPVSVSVPELASVMPLPSVLLPANTHCAPASMVPASKPANAAPTPVSVPMLAPELRRSVSIPPPPSTVPCSSRLPGSSCSTSSTAGECDGGARSAEDGATVDHRLVAGGGEADASATADGAAIG